MVYLTAAVALLFDKSQIYTTLKHLTRILKTLWNQNRLVCVLALRLMLADKTNKM